MDCYIDLITYNRLVIVGTIKTTIIMTYEL